MCLAVPGKVTSIEESEGLFRRGKVAFGPLHKMVNLSFVPQAIVGDYVLIHAGVAIALIDEGEAEQILNQLESLTEEEL